MGGDIHASESGARSCHNHRMYITIKLFIPTLTLSAMLSGNIMQQLEAIKEKIVEYVVERELTHADVVRILRTKHGINTSKITVWKFCSKHGMYIITIYPSHH